MHAIADLKRTEELADGIVLVVAPLLIAETVWHTEAAAWQDTRHLRIAQILGNPCQRKASLAERADIYVTNYDNICWLAVELAKESRSLALVVADESSKIKTPTAKRTKTMLELSKRAARRWGLTGTPRGQQLLDVWGPAQFVSQASALPPFYPWRARCFYPLDIYGRQFAPHAGVETATIGKLRPFTHVVSREALATRPPVNEIVHDILLDSAAAKIYEALDEDGVTDAVARKVAAGLLPKNEMAIVTKLMQVLSGAVYQDTGGWRRLHDRRLDMLEEIHAGHDRPTLVFIGFRHELERIKQRFPFAEELAAELIPRWNAGEIEMLVAHPASAGHGVNLQGGSNVAAWFSLPWSAELFQQANARIARQGQREPVTIHVLLSDGYIDELAYRAVQRRASEQDRLIAALA